jgi:YndJ-like protein
MRSDTKIYFIAGLVVWLLLYFIDLPFIGDLAEIAHLFLFAVLVVAPLPLALIASADELSAPWPLRTARAVYGPAAVFVVLSMLLPPGDLAALLTLPWLAFAALVALAGLARFIVHRLSSAPELCIAAGLLYLPVGAIWFTLSRLGANPLGFGDTIVLLTAVHFHYAGYALPIFAGWTGRWLARNAPASMRVFRYMAAGVVAGMALVAAGITVTALTGSLLLEGAAVAVLALSVLALSALLLRRVVEAVTNPLARVLLLLSALSPVVSMLFALAYAGGRLSGAWQLTIAQMISWHGWLNAVGLVLCGLLAWLGWRQTTRV